MRSPSRTCDEIWPSMAVFAASAMSLAVRPNLSASAARTRRLIEGPVSVSPLNVSTTPRTDRISDSTRGAVFSSQPKSGEKILISIGSGVSDKSPITSVRMPGNSQRIIGNCSANLWRS